MAKRKDYGKVVDAAWYVLNIFINPIDCSEKITFIQANHGDFKEVTKVLPDLKNFELASILSGTKKIFPSTFSKKKLAEHLSGETTYYYRSSYDSCYKTGYGASDGHARKLSFSEDLGITTKKNELRETEAELKSEGYKYPRLLLVGIDIDCHNGETDAEEVKNFITANYLSEVYWEPSTNGAGIHGYFKILYYRSTDLGYIRKNLTNYFRLINEKREIAGLSAEIDKPCGLPTTIRYETENPYTDIFKKKMPRWAKPELFYKKQKKGYIKVIRSQTIKMPRFNSADNPAAQVERVAELYNLGVYSFEDLMMDYAIAAGYEDSYEAFCDGLYESADSRYAKYVKWTDLCPRSTLTPAPVTEIDLLPVTEEDLGEEKEAIEETITEAKYSSNYPNNLQKLKSENDVWKRTRTFYFLYSLHLRYVPDYKSAADEYVKQGLNTDSTPCTQKRYDRFETTEPFIRKNIKFNNSFTFPYDLWDEEREELTQKIRNKIENSDSLRWDKGVKKKNGELKTYSVNLGEFAFIYFLIQQRCLFLHRNSPETGAPLSYDMIKKYSQEVTGSTFQTAKIRSFLRLLENNSLIKNTASYKVGKRGKCYKVNPLE